MNVLLVAPEGQETFWSMEHALPFMGVKAVIPPLGLITVAALLPEEWNLELVDMNISPLESRLLEWADMLFVSAMTAQSDSAREVVQRANEAGVKVVAGGPHYVHSDKPEIAAYLHVEGIHHIFLGEAEGIIDRFVSDLAKGQAKAMYRDESFPSLRDSPLPRHDLIDIHNYYCMGVQFSRGCPFNCEFCDVEMLNGRTPRYKPVQRFMAELDSLYKLGWRRAVMVVDDNFIGNKKETKKLLHEMIRWQREHEYPFFFFTQASINLADEPELGRLMAQAHFAEVFIGLETPSPLALEECAKKQNQNRDLVKAVHTVLGYGINVMAGFIVGFDSDTPDIFDLQREFIEEAAIPMAMIGILTAIPGTRLWERLEREGRLTGGVTVTNTFDDDALNFEPKLDQKVLLRGYADLLEKVFSPKAVHKRIARSIRYLAASKFVPRRGEPYKEGALCFRLLWTLGCRKKGRRDFWRLMFHVLFKYPEYMTQAMTMAGMAFHCRTLTEKYVAESREAHGRS